ncbi:MAG: hypothetical protein K8W52_24490 [Deltaproteobacteria bacterium]|nr:hypothetical protein [Deltaproteobacteria bacterium]
MKHLPFFALVLAACGPSVGASVDAKPGTADAATDAPVGPDANLTDAPLTEVSKVYAHSGKQLYRIDTTTAQPTPVLIGTFTDSGPDLGTASITDIAVDKAGKMTGCTLKKIFTIDPATAAVTFVAALPSGTPNITSLSYVPVDLNDPNSAEILVAVDTDGNVLKIEGTTITTVGSYGMSNGEVIGSSGDIVAVRGEGIFATVDIGTTLTNNDYLAKIDPTTWNATIVGTDLGVSKVFGLGYWRTKLYGFVDVGTGAGQILEIDPKTGAVTPGATGTIEWFGAGVTTDAPIVVN